MAALRGRAVDRQYASHLVLYDPGVNHRDLGGLVFHGRTWSGLGVGGWVGSQVGNVAWNEGIFFCLSVIFALCKCTRVLENPAIVHSAPASHFSLNPTESDRMGSS